MTAVGLRQARIAADSIQIYCWETEDLDAVIPGVPRDVTYREAIQSAMARLLRAIGPEVSEK